MNFYSRGPGNVCLLFDSAIGGGGTTANETTQTTSGQGRGVAGNKNQYTEGGAISVGAKGKYQESGSVDLSGQKNNTQYKVGKNGTVVINQAPLTGTNQPIASLTGPPGTVPSSSGPAPIPAPATDPNATPFTPSTSSAASLWQSIKDHWNAWSTYQKIGAGAAGVLIVWLLFIRRRRA